MIFEHNNFMHDQHKILRFFPILALIDNKYISDNVVFSASVFTQH